MLTDSERARIIGSRVARLATLNPVGGADLVPVTFALLDDDTVVSVVDHKPKTTDRLQRLRNIERDPRVTFLVDHYDDDWSALWWIRGRGEAEVVREGRVLEGAVTALRARYPQYVTDPPPGPAIVVHVLDWRAWASRPD